MLKISFSVLVPERAAADEKILKQLIVNYACSSLSYVGISYDRVSIGEALIAGKARRPSDSGKRRIPREAMKFESHRCYLMNWSIIWCDSLAVLLSFKLLIGFSFALLFMQNITRTTCNRKWTQKYKSAAYGPIAKKLLGSV